jgi:hypothetical protein
MNMLGVEYDLKFDFEFEIDFLVATECITH